MTTLSASPKPHMLKLAAIAQDLAPHLYRAEQAFHGISGGDWDALSPAQQRVFLERAEFTVLDSIGYLSSKARERAHRHAVVANDIFDEFNQDAARIIEKTMSEAVDDYPVQLAKLYRESVR